MSAYDREYQRAWEKKRADEALALLGGVCVVCGTAENLDFDHIDPKTKLFRIKAMLRTSAEKFWAEVAKCQLLCRPHHIEKSNAEGSTLKRGEDQGGSKLKEVDIPRIRELARLGYSQRAMAKEFGVARRTICDVLDGKSWRHV